MFYHIEGTVSEYTPQKLVLDCSGVGFEINITPNTAASVTKGEKKKIYVSESIGESNFDLFGFLTLSEKRFFQLLTGVSGIGPKAAMSVLSYNTPESLMISILNGDEKPLTSCPGIGKKTAQRIILELKDKVSKEFSSSETISIPSAAVPAIGGTAYDEAVSALSVLGYSASEVVPIIKKLDITGMTSDKIIKAVLQYMI